jgi:short-subunit dehydrogenase
MQAVLPHFKERNQGQILNVSSGLARMPLAPFRSAYSAAKHALNALSASLRMELAVSHPGIHVTVLMPGIVATEFGLNSLGGGPDSRALPGAQPVEEVADVMVDLVERPRPEAYSRPEMQKAVEGYYRDVGAAEAEALKHFGKQPR